MLFTTFEQLPSPAFIPEPSSVHLAAFATGPRIKLISSGDDRLSLVLQVYKSTGTNWRTAVLVGVHIRQTDLAKKMKERQKTLYADAYFNSARKYMERIFGSRTIVFVVCSDDIKWAKKHFKGGSNRVVYSEGNAAGVDFAILTKTNHTILTIGTFGRWAAYLTGGITVYFKYINEARSLRIMKPIFVRDKSVDVHWKGFTGME